MHTFVCVIEGEKEKANEKVREGEKARDIERGAGEER